MPGTTAWKLLRAGKQQLLGFALLFQIVESLIFAPLLGLTGHVLAGRPVVDSTELVSFALSPRGFLFLFLGATTLLTIRLLEHAGLSAIVLGALEGRAVRLRAAFRLMVQNLPRLVSIGALAIACGLMVASPMLAVAGFYAARLLSKHDINYYLAGQPPEFITAAVIVGVVAVVSLAAGAWLFVRWRMVVQVSMFERLHGRAAYRQAAALSRGARWSLAWRCAAVLALELALVFAAAGLGQATAWLVLGDSLGTLSLTLSLGLLALLRTVVSAAVTSTAACVSAGVFTAFYRKQRQALHGEPALPSTQTPEGVPAGNAARLWAAAIALGLCTAEFGIAFAIVDALQQERSVSVTAHRGGHQKAPENTGASIREAIAVGAQYAEIDVQFSKDGVLVVTHDSDFSRMAGVPTKVWELTYDEIRMIPLGARSAAEFRNEPAPTFGEVLDIARERIKLNVELKYYAGQPPRLAERVVQEIRSHAMDQQVVIQCLEYQPLQEVRRLAPEIPVGYLLSVNARQPSRLEVDFLSVESKRLTGAFVRAAHRRGQLVFVWTVDKPASMVRMMDLGVDSLITDQPAEALRLVREFESLSPAERLLRETRAWLAN